MSGRGGDPVRPAGDPTGTLVFSTPASAATLSRQQKAGRAIKLATGIYVAGATLPTADLTRHHLWEIVAHYWSGAVVSDRSALTAGPTDGWLFLAHPEPPRAADLQLPGVSITCRIGPGPLPGDMPWPAGLHLSGVARGLVENLTARGGRPPADRPPRAAGEIAVGDRIDSLATSGDPGKIHDALAQLDQIADKFDAAAVTRTRQLLVAVLGTVAGPPIASPRLAARTTGKPYDAARAELFTRIRTDLDALAPSVRPALGDPTTRRWLPFFEAYFSNYIEGTEFGVDEARRIAIDGKIPAERPADAHDVVATYSIVNDDTLMRQVPTTAEQLLDILTDRHRILMAGRPDKRPGRFKEKPNYADRTAFVAPQQLTATLHSGWDALDGLTDPFHRAVLMMFVVTECHPFDDGNGRVARILTNAELVARNQTRIVVPNAYRGNYLAGLTAATHGAGGHALASVLDFTRKWVASIDFSDWDRAIADLEASNAFVDSVVAEQSGRRLRLPN